jgi:subtilisin family serine protease
MKLMKLGQVVAGVVVATAVLSGCTQTLILFKPSAVISPMPNTDCKDDSSGADPMAKQQWSLKQLGVMSDDGTLATDMLQGNKNVKIALLSTGVDYNHEDLCGQIAVDTSQIVQKAAGEKEAPKDKNSAVVGWNVVDNDGFAYDRHGAGTAVAGIIAAKQNNGKGVAGLIANASIFPVKYINDNGQTSVPWLVSGLQAAMKANPHVIFLQTAAVQLGGNRHNPEVAKAETALLKSALDKVQKAKIPIVIGAGDSMDVFGVSGLDKLLASYDNIIVVTAIDKNSEVSVTANVDQNNVLTAAPGEGIMTTKPGNKYAEVNGSAYAAAHVTAALGLARANLGDRMDYRKMVNLLLSPKASDQVPSLGRLTRGSNRLQLAKFLGELKSL